ncbi:hypothetical protein OJIADAOI_00049 [Pseudomonas phage SPA05]|uniref:Uncharacterized protein n=1 Tax=Pseudomonas phage SPA05 TaxID=3003720 RepID=A0AAF0ILQ5_9CAUD|nr:hypothetical protein QE323_gp143 [Pseudomonas phage SPA05]WEY17820.1 hypothetical protein OJIADAOI_00049 [Pseudomonas phage SPA05]
MTIDVSDFTIEELLDLQVKVIEALKHKYSHNLGRLSIETNRLSIGTRMIAKEGSCAIPIGWDCEVIDTDYGDEYYPVLLEYSNPKNGEYRHQWVTPEDLSRMVPL